MKHFIVYNSNFERTYGRFDTLEAARKHRNNILAVSSRLAKCEEFRPEYVVIYEANTVE